MTQPFPPPPGPPQIEALPFSARFIITVLGTFVPSPVDRQHQDHILIESLLTDLQQTLRATNQQFAARQLATLTEPEVALFFFQEQYQLRELLPRHLWGTATHIADQDLFLVGVRSLANSGEISPMVFRGVIDDGRIIGVSIPTQFGHSLQVQPVDAARVVKIDPQDVAARTIFPADEEDYQIIRIEIRGGVLQDVAGLPEGWAYRLIDHDEPAASDAEDEEEEEDEEDAGE